jgi:hypothetical protein
LLYFGIIWEASLYPEADNNGGKPTPLAINSCDFYFSKIKNLSKETHFHYIQHIKTGRHTAEYLNIIHE